MFPAVCGQILFDAAEVRNFLQVAVCLLIADNRKACPLLKTYRMWFIFLQDCQWNRKKRNIGYGTWLSSSLKLYTSFSYPPVTVIVLLQMFRSQCGNISERQTGEQRKKHQSKGDGNKENQTERVVKQRFCGCLPLQPNSKERQDNASFPLPSHYLSCYQLKAKKQHS